MTALTTAHSRSRHRPAGPSGQACTLHPVERVTTQHNTTQHNRTHLVITSLYYTRCRAGGERGTCTALDGVHVYGAQVDGRSRRARRSGRGLVHHCRRGATREDRRSSPLPVTRSVTVSSISLCVRVCARRPGGAGLVQEVAPKEGQEAGGGQGAGRSCSPHSRAPPLWAAPQSPPRPVTRSVTYPLAAECPPRPPSRPPLRSPRSCHRPTRR